MEFLKQVLMMEDISMKFALGEVFLTIGVSFFLSLMITWVYQKTYKGAYYSQAFVHTLVIVCVVIAMIIVAIGSNIARAFSLAGALSIIRFRSAISDPKDIAFIFFVMGAGLATGAGLYIPAFFFVLILSVLILLIHFLDYGAQSRVHKKLKITIPENLNYEGLFDDLLEEHLENHRLLSVKTTNLGTMYELSYAVETKVGQSDKQLMDLIRSRNGNLNVAMLLDAQSME